MDERDSWNSLHRVRKHCRYLFTFFSYYTEARIEVVVSYKSGHLQPAALQTYRFTDCTTAIVTQACNLFIAEEGGLCSANCDIERIVPEIVLSVNPPYDFSLPLSVLVSERRIFRYFSVF